MDIFQPGNLLYFDPFIFPDGGTPKPKYFLVLAEAGHDVVLASLPTSKDHVPSDIPLQSGCLEMPQRMINVFVMKGNEPITEDGFFFRVNTFVYGANIKTYSPRVFIEQEANKVTVITVKGKMKGDIYLRLIECLKNSDAVRKRYKKYFCPSGN